MIIRIERRLIAMYGHLPPDQVAGAIRNARARFEPSTVRDFIPLLIERRARAELAAAT